VSPLCFVVAAAVVVVAVVVAGVPVLEALPVVILVVLLFNFSVHFLHVVSSKLVVVW